MLSSCVCRSVRPSVCLSIYPSQTSAVPKRLNVGSHKQRHTIALLNPTRWNAHNTVFGSKRSVICAQVVYFLHSTRTSVTWLNSQRWLAAYDRVMLASSAMLSTCVGHGCRRKFGEVSCTVCTFQGNDFELIAAVKVKTINPVDGYFGSEFPAICNHCGIMATWSLKSLIFKRIVLRFIGKTTPYSNFFKIMYRKLSSRHRSTCRRYCVQILRILADRKSVKSRVALKILPGCPAVATARIAPKICQPLSMYSECSRLHPNQFTFGGITTERVNTAKTHRKVNPIFDWSLSSSLIFTFIHQNGREEK